MWSGRDGEAEEAAEGGLGRAAAIEAEDELAEPRVRLAGPRPGSGLEVLLAQPVVDPQRPPLRVREDAVDPGQHRVRRRVADHPRVVLDVLEPRVAGPAVAHHRAAGGDHGGDEGAERDGRVVLDHREPGPPRALAPDLDRTGDQQLAVVRPPGPGRLAPAAEGQA